MVILGRASLLLRFCASSSLSVPSCDLFFETVSRRIIRSESSMAEATDPRSGGKALDQIDIEKQVSSLEPVSTADDRLTLHQTTSRVSNQDMHPVVSYIEPDDAIYDRLSLTRKHVITAILSLCGFLAPISSTTVLAAVPEVAATYNTTGTIINLSNALYMVFMGISPILWGPLGQTYGRRWVSMLAYTYHIYASVREHQRG